jgi:hypothetical protein
MVKPVPTIPLEQFRRIAKDLLAKTRAGKVHWASKTTRTDFPEVSYEVVLPESRIVMNYGIPRAAPDFVSLNLINPDGIIVDSWAVDEPDYDPEHEPIEHADPEGDWRLLHGLFSEIHKQATGWDKVLSDVEKALASDEPIGKPTRP